MVNESTPVTSNRSYTKPGDPTLNTLHFALNRINTLGDDVDTDVDALDVRLTTAEGDITTAEGDITTNAGNISTNTGNISTNATDIDTLEGKIFETVVFKDNTFTAGHRASYAVDSSSNPGFVCSLDASPVIGDVINFYPVNDWSVDGFTLDPNGAKIEGVADTVNVNYTVPFSAVYVNVTIGYKIFYAGAKHAKA